MGYLLSIDRFIEYYTKNNWWFCSNVCQQFHHITEIIHGGK